MSLLGIAGQMDTSSFAVDDLVVSIARDYAQAAPITPVYSRTPVFTLSSTTP